MAYLEYGTAEFYADRFADYIGEADYDDPNTVDNIIRGFYLAIDEWFEYHTKQAEAHAQLRERVRKALAVWDLWLIRCKLFVLWWAHFLFRM